MKQLKRMFGTSAFVILAGCVTPGPLQQGSDVPVDGGTVPVSRRAPQAEDCDNVIPILADTTANGIAREDAWIAKNHPGATAIARRLTECDGAKAEVITLRDANGLDFNVTFDISSFFGKTSSGDNLDDLLDG